MMSARAFWLSIVVVAAAAACEDRDQTPVRPATAGFGKLHVVLTDAPLEDRGVTAVNICIERVDLVFADSRPTATMDVSRTIDLLKLQNGVTTSLGIAEFPVGLIQQVRLILCPDGASVIIDGVEVPVKVPSGEQTGIKLLYPGGFEISENTTTLIVLDFDAEKSIHQAGNKWMLTPVVQLVEKAIVLAVTDPSPGDFVKPTVTVRGTVASKEPLASLTVNGVEATVDGLDWSAEITLAEGPVVIQVEATDALGRTAAIEIEVVADGTPPAIRIIQPEPQSAWNSLIVPVEIFLEDSGSGVVEGETRISIDGEDVTSTLVVSTGEVTGQIVVSPGHHFLEIVVIDRVGNWATAQAAFHVDAAPPEVEIVSPGHGATFLSGVVPIDVTFSDDSTIDLSSLRVFLNQTEITAHLAVDNQFATGTADIYHGEHELLAIVRDVAGNEGSARAVFDVQLPLSILQELDQANGPDGYFVLPATGGGIRFIGGSDVAPGCTVPAEVTHVQAQEIVECFLEKTADLHGPSEIPPNHTVVVGVEDTAEPDGTNFVFIHSKQTVGDFPVLGGEFKLVASEGKVIQFVGYLYSQTLLPQTSHGYFAQSQEAALANASAQVNGALTPVTREYSVDLQAGVLVAFMTEFPHLLVVFNETTGLVEQVGRSHKNAPLSKWADVDNYDYQGSPFDLDTRKLGAPHTNMPIQVSFEGYDQFDRCIAGLDYGSRRGEPTIFSDGSLVTEPVSCEDGGKFTPLPEPFFLYTATSLYFWLHDMAEFLYHPQSVYRHWYEFPAPCFFCYDYSGPANIDLHAYSLDAEAACGGVDACTNVFPYSHMDLAATLQSGRDLAVVAHEYGHYIAAQYQVWGYDLDWFGQSRLAIARDEAIAHTNVLRYMIYRYREPDRWSALDPNAPIDVMPADFLHRIDEFPLLTGGARHGETVVHGVYSMDRNVEKLVYDEWGVCGPGDEFEEHDCGLVIAAIYRELARNGMSMGYMGYPAEHVVLSEYNGDSYVAQPERPLNVSVTYALRSSTAFSGVKEFAAAMVNRYDVFRRRGELSEEAVKRVNAVMNHHCLGWEPSCRHRTFPGSTHPISKSNIKKFGFIPRECAVNRFEDPGYECLNDNLLLADSMTPGQHAHRRYWDGPHLRRQRKSDPAQSIRFEDWRDYVRFEITVPYTQSYSIEGLVGLTPAASHTLRMSFLQGDTALDFDQFDINWDVENPVGAALNSWHTSPPVFLAAGRYTVFLWAESDPADDCSGWPSLSSCHDADGHHIDLEALRFITCMPLQCTDLPGACGFLPDGCGGQIWCGYGSPGDGDGCEHERASCTSLTMCWDDGELTPGPCPVNRGVTVNGAPQCECVPRTCAELGQGDYPDGCGARVNCGGPTFDAADDEDVFNIDEPAAAACNVLASAVSILDGGTVLWDPQCPHPIGPHCQPQEVEAGGKVQFWIQFGGSPLPFGAPGGPRKIVWYIDDDNPDTGHSHLACAEDRDPYGTDRRLELQFDPATGVATLAVRFWPAFQDPGFCALDFGHEAPVCSFSDLGQGSPRPVDGANFELHFSPSSNTLELVVDEDILLFFLDALYGSWLWGPPGRPFVYRVAVECGNGDVDYLPNGFQQWGTAEWSHNSTPSVSVPTGEMDSLPALFDARDQCQ